MTQYRPLATKNNSITMWQFPTEKIILQTESSYH